MTGENALGAGGLPAPAQGRLPSAQTWAWVGLVGALAAVAPLSIDMYLPGLPAMALDLKVGPSEVQLTLTAFMVGLALGQLIIGPISDRLGRRAPLIGGTLLGLLAGVACAMAPTVTSLITFRFVQGFGAGAGMVLGRAIVSDRTHGWAAARMFSLAMAITSIAPVVAPLLGGVIVTRVGWRAVFWVLAGLAAVLFAAVALCFRETHPPDRRIAHERRTLIDALGLLRHRRYLGYLLASALGFAVLFTYISASPYLLQKHFGLTELQYSLVFAANAAALTVMSVLNSVIVPRVGRRRPLHVGAALLVVLCLLLLINTLRGPSLWPTLILFWFIVAAVGLGVPNATALAADEVRHAAGTGSAMLGALQFGFAALASLIVGVAAESSAVPMSATMLVAAVAIATSLALAHG